jgi:hypothetical protein
VADAEMSRAGTMEHEKEYHFDMHLEIGIAIRVLANRTIIAVYLSWTLAS